MISNLNDLAVALSADVGATEDETLRQIKRRLYKDTDCGAWCGLTAGGVVIGSIVEGSDAEVQPKVLLFPFTQEHLDWAVEQIEEEADRLWREANEDMEA